jgi:hypothetical protein
MVLGMYSVIFARPSILTDVFFCSRQETVDVLKQGVQQFASDSLLRR